MQQRYQCIKCGAPLAYGVEYCGNCGTQLNWSTQHQRQPPPTYPSGNYPIQQQRHNESKQESSEKKKTNPWLLGFLLLTLVAMWAPMLFFSFNNYSKGTSQISTNPPVTSPTPPPITTPSNLTPTTKTPQVLHNQTLEELNSNPAYWNLAWQGKYAEMESKTLAINQAYNKTHTYIKGETDCNDMAIDIWNILQTEGIVSIIVIGTLDKDGKTIADCNHAWLMINMLYKGDSKPSGFVLEPTNGEIYFGEDANLNPVLNRYWRGYGYTKPSDLREDLGQNW